MYFGKSDNEQLNHALPGQLIKPPDSLLPFNLHIINLLYYYYFINPCARSWSLRMQVFEPTTAFAFVQTV